jgi:hypothetical protein
MTKRTVLSTLAGLAACGALAPAAAPAAPTYGAAAFKAELRGTQVTTWEYHVDTAKDDPCSGAKVDAFGDQTLRFASGTKGRLLLGKPAGGRPTVALMKDTKQFGLWEVPVTAERTGTRIAGDVDRSMCEGDNGGGVEPRRREDKDCGRREGQLTPELEVAGRSRATLGGRTAEWTDDPTLVPLTGETSDKSLHETYEDCQFWEGGPYAPESEAGLLPATEKLPLAAMLDPRRKRIVIDFGHVKEYRAAGFVGKTIVTGKLTLTRTGLVPRG